MVFPVFGRRTWMGALVLACAIVLPGVAQAVDSAQLQLESFIQKVQSATGQFQQEQAGKDGVKRAQSGTFAFQRPGKFRWQVVKPYAQLIVSDGQRVYQYDPDLEQVTERKAGQAIGASPAALLFGSGSLDDAFKLQAQEDHDGLQWLRAVPKSPDAGFVHVDIGFSDGLPRQLVLLDAFGQTSRIQFAELKANPGIAASQFQFSVPKGAALVKMN
ncbi:outer membrane lipoprotein chaperone LolA [Castellaniella caeni]|uniref:outer membrane lipoprotein chaperone LolA n=1 Tax=Castellaniella caeni TaxID=266123 RepID=UPI00082BF440|nr:outer membrane lipoprotein chaperone LolA [Castellaniella caeni]